MTIIKKFDTEEIKTKANLFNKKYIVLSILGLLSLVIIQIWVSNITLIYGEKFQSTENIKGSLLLENQILENSISRESSLLEVATKSFNLGFSKPESIKYIR